MRTTYIKQNSQTQKQVRRAVDTVSDICQRAGISMDEWLSHFFELGCHFCEERFTDNAALDMLTNESNHFWAWWMRLYIQDDANILSANNSIQIEDGLYFQEKSKIISYITLPNEKVQNKA